MWIGTGKINLKFLLRLTDKVGMTTKAKLDRLTEIIQTYHEEHYAVGHETAIKNYREACEAAGITDADHNAYECGQYGEADAAATRWEDAQR